MEQGENEAREQSADVEVHAPDYWVEVFDMLNPLPIQYFFIINILPDSFIDINIDIFKNTLIYVDIFKNDPIDIDIFKKCQYINNRYGLSIS